MATVLRHMPPNASQQLKAHFFTADTYNSPQGAKHVITANWRSDEPDWIRQMQADILVYAEENVQSGFSEDDPTEKPACSVQVVLDLTKVDGIPLNDISDAMLDALVNIRRGIAVLGGMLEFCANDTLFHKLIESTDLRFLQIHRSRDEAVAPPV